MKNKQLNKYQINKRLTFFIALFPFILLTAKANTVNTSTTVQTVTPKGTTPFLKPFTAKYSILHKSKKVGNGVRKLVYLNDNTLEYSYKSDISWLIFSDSRTEISTLNYQGDILTPLKYEYKREGTGSDKHYVWLFDAKNNTATNVKKKKTVTVDFSKPLQDTLSYHLQHRLKMIEHPEQKQFVYPVIKTSGKVQNYVFQYDGEEELMLPYGLVQTIRLKREVIEKKRITYAWYAPKLNCLLVKLYQVKDNIEQFEIQLTSLKVEE
jgi:hypothetical protein